MNSSLAKGVCRVCGRPLFEVPLFRFTGMPSVAQNFPDQDSLSEDRGADFEVAQCSGCGLVQLPREPVAYYRDVIRAAGVSPEMTSHRHEQFASFTRTFELAGKPVIEIGCGGGEYLQMLRDAGLSAVGLEHSKAGVAACRAKGLRVYQGFVDSARYQIPGAPYAGFVMLSCLEHLPDVNGALQGLGHNLLPGAIGMVEVPNFDNCLAERAVAEFMTDHLSYFTRDSLATTLQLNGFEVLECRPTGHDYLLTAIVRRRTPHSVAAFHQVTQQLDAASTPFWASLASARWWPGARGTTPWRPSPCIDCSIASPTWWTPRPSSRGASRRPPTCRCTPPSGSSTTRPFKRS